MVAMLCLRLGVAHWARGRIMRSGSSNTSSSRGVMATCSVKSQMWLSQICLPRPLPLQHAAVTIGR